MTTLPAQRYLLITLMFLVGVNLTAEDDAIGPFADWVDVKADHGAVGNGVADDTAAIQAALDQLSNDGPRAVVYFPAGTYRISGTLSLHNTRNARLIGRDPATTVLRWAGPANGDLLKVMSVTGMSIGRLTFDGAGTGRRGLWSGWEDYTDYFPTRHEYHDLRCVNWEVGMQLGDFDEAWQSTVAELSIRRCMFSGARQSGIVVQDWNTVDVWVRQSLFTGNRAGISVLAGSINALDNRFDSSGFADIYTQNCEYSAMRWNQSRSSACFLRSGGPTTTGERITIQGNTILDCAGIDADDGSPMPAISIPQPGPIMLIDNAVQMPAGWGQPCVRAGVPGWGSEMGQVISIGNRYSASPAIELNSASRNRLRTLDDLIVARASISAAAPVYPGTPAWFSGPVSEVTTFTSTAIQAAIDAAVRDHAGQHPVVRLRKGDYQVADTIVVPAGSDVRLVGSAPFFGYTHTRLKWNGAEDGRPVIRLAGPSRAELRDFQVQGPGRGTVDGIVAEDADQDGGSVFFDQLESEHATTAEMALQIDGLQRSAVEIWQLYGGGDAGHLDVRGPGGGAWGTRVFESGGNPFVFTDGPVFQVHDGGWLVVHDLWYENGHQFTPLVRLRDQSRFTYHSGKMQYYDAGINTREQKEIDVAGPAECVLLGLQLLASDIAMDATDPGMHGLMLGCTFNTQSGVTSTFANNGSSGRAVALNNSTTQRGDGPSLEFTDVNPSLADDAWLRARLADTRSVGPSRSEPQGSSGATSLTVRRVAIAGVRAGLRVRAGSSHPLPNAPPTISEGAGVAVRMDEDGSPAAFNLTLHAVDSDAGDTLTWSISGTAGHGSATAAASGPAAVIDYAPGVDFSGADSFTVRVSDGHGGVDTCLVTVTVDPRNDAPVNTTAPTIAGTLTIGQTMTSTVGTWNDARDGGTATISYARQWQRADDANGLHEADIPGATTATYLLATGDDAKSIRVRVTATDNGTGLPASQSAVAASAWSTPVHPVGFVEPAGNENSDGRGCGLGGILGLFIVGAGFILRGRGCRRDTASTIR